MSKLIKFEPNYSLQSLYDEMGRLLRDSFSDIEFFNPSSTAKTWIPAVELIDEGNQYIVKAELPGMKKEDIKIDIGEKFVKIEAEAKCECEEKKKNFYRSEFKYGKFVRHLPLDTDVKADMVKAEYKDGILIVNLPKVETQAPNITSVKID